MRVIDAIAEILKRESVEYLSCYPTTSLIEAAAAAGIRPIVCRQERVGVGIADGFSRVKNGNPPGVFAMQYGPGAENAFAGVATAFADSTPLLLLPLGHNRLNEGVYPLFSSQKAYESITRSVDHLGKPDKVVESLRRAFAAATQGRGGPALVEIPDDVATADVPGELLAGYHSKPRLRAQGNPQDVEKAAQALIVAERPVRLAGAGVLYAEATAELRELAE